MADPFSKDIFGWMTGGSEGNRLNEMFGGASNEKMWGALAGQEQNVGNTQAMLQSLFGNTQQQYMDTSQARQGAIERANELMSGKYDPTSSPAYGPMRKGVEGAYSGARENILSGLPSGGVQQQALGDLETKRAGNLSDIMSQIITGEMQNAYSTANQSFPNMLSGMTSAVQGAAVPGQMMGSILEYFAKLMQSSVQGQGNITGMI